MNKPNCYECKYIGNVPGSAHHKCNHPAFDKLKDNPILELISILGGAGRLPPIHAESNECKVVGNPHGIRNGWFNHPFNFDPTWLEECSGFTPKESK